MDILAQVKALTHEMRLHGLHASLERRASEALADQMHPLDFIRLLLEDERCHRKEMVAKRLLTKAKFRRSCDIEGWDMTRDRGISKQRLRDLTSLSFLRSKENLLIFGRTGEGKTHLAMALGQRLCWEGVATRFFSTNLLFEEVNAEKVCGRYLNFINNITKIPVIILDDFGLRSYSHDEATILLDILEARYQRGLIIVTSQVDSQGWGNLFADAIIREAILDRLTKPGQSIVLSGGSYRDHLAKVEVDTKKLEPRTKKN